MFVVNKRIAIVSGDVRAIVGVVSVQAGGDTSVPVRVYEGDTVVMNTGCMGGATTVGVDSGSVVTPVIDLLSDVDHVLSADASPSGGG